MGSGGKGMFGHEHRGGWEKAGRALGFATGGLVFTTMLSLAMSISGRLSSTRSSLAAAAITSGVILTSIALKRALR